MRHIKLSALVAIVAAAASGTILFWSSQQVQTAESTLRKLRADVATEKKTIRVLSAEWDYLNRPDRLEELARQYLQMVPPTAKQMVDSAAHLPDVPVALEEEIPSVIPEAASLNVSSPAPAASVPAAALSPTENRSFQTLLNDLEADKVQ